MMAFASTKGTFGDFISTMLFKTTITNRISGEQRRLPPPAEGTETVGRHKARVRIWSWNMDDAATATLRGRHQQEATYASCKDT
jgi:hypothetical protein